MSNTEEVINKYIRKAAGGAKVKRIKKIRWYPAGHGPRSYGECIIEADTSLGEIKMSGNITPQGTFIDVDITLDGEFDIVFDTGGKGGMELEEVPGYLIEKVNEKIDQNLQKNIKKWAKEGLQHALSKVRGIKDE